MVRSPVAIFLLALVLDGAHGARAVAEPFRRRPYAQSVTTSEVVLKWTQGSGAALLRYGPRGEPPIEFVDAATTSGDHELRLTGLLHSTRYAYSVDAGPGDGHVERGEFSTAVLPAEPFTFLVYGDNRSSESDHRCVAVALAGEAADFVVNTGDLVDHGFGYEYDAFFRIEAPLLARDVLFPALGNHECGLGGVSLAAWEQAFATPSVSSGTERYYSFDYGNARFVVLDFNAPTATQTAWLAAALADARAHGSAHLFAVLHHGPFDSGAHGENAQAARDWVPLFSRYRVDLVLSGHDHDYERGRDPRTSLRYIVTGGGGAPLYNVNARRPYQERFAATLHYVRIAVAGPAVTVTAVQPDGVVIDEFSFRAEAPAGPGDAQPAVATEERQPARLRAAPPVAARARARSPSDADAVGAAAELPFDARFAALAAVTALALGLVLVVWRRRSR